MADPSSANTRPSAMASRAPTPQAISDCGPPSVAMIAGTVINGPVPTMFDMLIEMAFSNPRRRGMRPWVWPADTAAVPGWVNPDPLVWIMGTQDTAIEKFGLAISCSKALSNRRPMALLVSQPFIVLQAAEIHYCVLFARKKTSE